MNAQYREPPQRVLGCDRNVRETKPEVSPEVDAARYGAAASKPRGDRAVFVRESTTAEPARGFQHCSRETTRHEPHSASGATHDRKGSLLVHPLIANARLEVAVPR